MHSDNQMDLRHGETTIVVKQLPQIQHLAARAQCAVADRTSNAASGSDSRSTRNSIDSRDLRAPRGGLVGARGDSSPSLSSGLLACHDNIYSDDVSQVCPGLCQGVLDSDGCAPRRELEAMEFPPLSPTGSGGVVVEVLCSGPRGPKGTPTEAHTNIINSNLCMSSRFSLFRPLCCFSAACPPQSCLSLCLSTHAPSGCVAPGVPKGPQGSPGFPGCVDSVSFL